jgi:cell division protein FtsQ
MSVVTPLPSDDRAPHRSERSHGLFRRLLRFSAALSLLCAAAAFPASALFNLEAVTVAGNVTVPSDEIRGRAGVGPGLNAFRVNAGLIRRRLLEDPRIRSVSVTVTFPSRLGLTIAERTPAAALAVGEGEGYFHLSADGVALAAAADPESLPIVVADRLNPVDVVVGKVLQSSDARLGSRIAGSLPAAIRDRVAGVHVDGAGEASLALRGGVTVRLGGPAGIAERLEMVPDVLDAIATRGLAVESVDLRVPGNVVVRPLDPAAALRGGQEKVSPRGIEPAMHRPSFP